MAALLVAPSAAHAQQLTRCDSGEPTFAHTTLPARYEIGPQVNAEVTSPVDGAKIDVAYFLPKVPAGTKVPVVVNATPCHHAQSTLDVRRCKPYYVDNFVPQGYAVAFVAVRGTGDSGGCMDLFGPSERADVNRAVTWLAEQPWSTGAAGMIGKSYEGGTPWEVALLGNPHLKTIVTVAGVPDVFELLYGGANIDFRGPALLNDLYYGPSIFTYADGRAPARTVAATACPGYAIGNEAAAHSSLTGEEDPLGYWAARRYRRAIERNYRGSVLLVQGFEDLNVPPGNQFPWINRARRKHLPLKLMLGQWFHDNPDQPDPPAQRKDWPDIELAWFDRWLRGNLDADTGPAAEVEDSAGKWRSETRWPPRWPARTLWLGAAGDLRDSPDEGSALTPLVPDPLHVQPATLSMPSTPLDAACPAPTCSARSLGPVAQPLRFAGRPLLRLSVSAPAGLGYVSAYLYADDGAGAQRIGWGQTDVRQSASGGVLRMRLQPLDSVVPAGSLLVLVLSQGAAYDRIPSVPSAPLLLRTGGRASFLRVDSFRSSAG